jgi:endoglucanase
MRHRKSSLWIVVVCLLALPPQLWAEEKLITLNDQEYFAAPGFSFLLFHNNYQVGYQGGLQMIQHEERLLDSGDFFLAPKSEGERPEMRILERRIDRQNQTATIVGDVEGWKLGYQLICHSDGRQILVTLKLDHPLDWGRIRQAGFRIFIYPGTYYFKSYQGDSGSGVFPRQYSGQPVLLRSTKFLRVAEEDALRSFSLSCPRGSISLLDNRGNDTAGWFSAVAEIPPGSADTEVSLAITPNINTKWRRPPVLGVSQVGYHPQQSKRVVLELDPRDAVENPVKLYRLQPGAEKELVLSKPPKSWGRFLRYQYAILDFSEIRQPGLYWLEFQGQTAGPIQISPDLYKQVWQPTLESFLPVQMCHVAVKEAERTWHGACHLDDALQAPAGKIHIDGYQQGAHETPYADNQHIDGLDWGGWHDAGDYDLPAGSIAMTTLALVLAQEEFRPVLDETSVRRTEREVLLHVPDGQSDLLQQIAFGAESLLASYRISGHIFPGIIETNEAAYGMLGDTINVTDNHVYDPKLKPNEMVCNRSGKFDDRWVFTNRNTGLQYETAQTLAAASRVLRGFLNSLADECLKTAQKLWEYEQSHPPVYAPNAYVPRDSGFRSQETAATAELLITTAEKVYQDRLLGLLPTMRSMTAQQFGEGPGWTLVRALPRLSDPEFKKVIQELAGKWKKVVESRMASNPYGVPYPSEVSNPGWNAETRSGIHSGFVWGHGWNLQESALRSYYFHKHMPELFDREMLLNVVNFVLGCHPASNQSFVSAVGVNSSIIAYGFNRADWSHIPGGVISGVSLVKPDFMELKVFPHLWYQTEYVIGGAATYIFDVLAANQWLGE